MDEETYEDFMSSGSDDQEEQTQDQEEQTNPDAETNQEVVIVELADYEFVQDKESGNWTMNDATYKKLISKIFE